MVLNKRICIVFVTTLVFSVILTGCVDQSVKGVSKNGLLPRKIEKTIDEPEVVKEVEKKIEVDQKKSEKEPSDIKIVQPNSLKQGEINQPALGALDNTMHGWGLSLYGNKRIPGIPEETKRLISKYNTLYVGDITKKVVYLTFDEGYENGYTASILDTLKKNNIKSIFFITGPYLKENKALVERMLEEGHLLGNHTINHPSLPSKSDEEIKYELLTLEKQLNEQFGKGFTYVRPPKGEYSERTLAITKQLGYKTIFWSYAYLDYDINNQKGKDNAYKVVMGNLHNGAIILLHAVSKDNAEALDQIIKGIQAEGYEISAFDL